MDEKYMQKIIENEQRSKNNEHRIDDLEIEQKSQRELIISVKELATEVKHMREDMNTLKAEQKNDRESLNSRLKLIEEKPAKKWEKLVSIVVTGIVSAVLGFFLAKFGL